MNVYISAKDTAKLHVQFFFTNKITPKSRISVIRGNSFLNSTLVVSLKTQIT